MNKNIIGLLLICLGVGLGMIIWYFSFPPFSRLSAEEMRARIISERDFAIKRAVDEGKYNCCVAPVCTMCYLEGNQWNYQRAGECDCAGFIQKGETPCPQCVRILNKDN